HDLTGAALLALAVSLVLGLYILRIESKQPTTPKQLLLLGVIIIGAVVAAKLLIPGRELYAFLFPIAAAPILVAVLLDAQLAIITAAVLSLLVAYIGSISPDSQGLAQISALGILQRATVYLLSGVAGVLFVGRGERLNRFAVAGVAVTLVLIVVNLAFWLFSPSHELSRLGWFSAVSLGNGSLSAILSVGIFLLMGYIFGVPTSFHLMELSQPNQPLLRRLLTEAPGTYHHSIIVGNLGERAADMIGADSLLVRVGCYYHDIGKLRRPAYFIENQMAGVNVHESLDPRQSASIVTEHIRDGLELAERYKLPPRLRAFIPEHHGTRLASYFYRRAKEQGLDVNPEDFRYPGPKPQSKETAIVMLADSVEATARSKDDHSPEQLDATVDAVIAERLEERQLDECDLTLRDLEIIRRAFKDVLRGIYHPRLEYPAPVAGERAATTGDEGAQQPQDDQVSRLAHLGFRVLPGGKKRPDT
ncbi:MAG: HDIG domain-containing protein, partial [Chloroflexi bacterium]|nr:HDIG domain-containing protein [Chloroflexota bacterium]